MNRVITIEYGQEFKISRNSNIQDNDFFYPIYEQALGQLKEILQYGEVKDIKPSQDYLHNIIAFCGERGQGKTSAMLSFSDALREVNDKQSNNEFVKKISDLKRKFYVLDSIDPTQMENNENILSIILSRIFMAFKKYWDKWHERDKGAIVARNDLLNGFQRCYNQIQTIKTNSKATENQNLYEESLQELFNLGDSSNLKTDLRDIIKEFFKLYDPESHYVLVIQIDDTDLNVKKAYEIVEDLRKYFKLPDIVILMASKIEQLGEIVEQQFHKDYAVLLQSRIKRDELLHNTTQIALLRSHTIQDEPRHIAAKYLGKLIPENRRIYLPDPSAIPDRTEEIITIKYMRNH